MSQASSQSGWRHSRLRTPSATPASPTMSCAATPACPRARRPHFTICCRRPELALVKSTACGSVGEKQYADSLMCAPHPEVDVGLSDEFLAHAELLQRRLKHLPRTQAPAQRNSRNAPGTETCPLKLRNDPRKGFSSSRTGRTIGKRLQSTVGKQWCRQWFGMSSSAYNQFKQRMQAHTVPYDATD